MKKFICLVSVSLIFLVGSNLANATTIESTDSSSTTETTVGESSILDSSSQKSWQDSEASTNLIEKEPLKLNFSMLSGTEWVSSLLTEDTMTGIKAALSDDTQKNAVDGITYTLTTIDNKVLTANDGEELLFSERSLKSVSFSLSTEQSKDYTLKYRVCSDNNIWSDWTNDGLTAEKSKDTTYIKNIELSLEEKQKQHPPPK